jgi:hypothetical protein
MLTRAEIENLYRVENGVIRSPGKFEGEPVFVPYLWDWFLEGGDRYDEDEGVTFELGPVGGADHAEIVAEFPELAHVGSVTLVETDTGFVCVARLATADANSVEVAHAS